ncbi:MAG TPA: hypothetical protein VEK15_30440 [Vicinamibacteria bacterium]|nr:hypothetical protein [Vicinamibacteria bacterium]
MTRARARRAEWTVRRYRLGEEPGDDLSESTTAEERIDMMWELAVSAWTLAGRELPTYSREHMPSRLYRRGETPPDDDDDDDVASS